MRIREDSTYLHEAAFSESVEAVRLLLEAGLSVHDKRHYNWTPLMCACSRTYDPAGTEGGVVVAELLRHGSDIQARDTYGNTPLHLVVASGFSGAVSILLEQGADPNAADKAGKTPLHHAAGSPVHHAGTAEIISETLLKAGADANAITVRGGVTPLHIAAARASVNVIDLLIRHRANINAADATGRTPVEEAIGQPENFAALVAAGGDITPLTKGTGKPTLLTAAEKGNMLGVKLLLANGSDPNKLYRGKAPLHMAVAKAHVDTVAALLAAGADHLLADKDGATALDLARKRRRKAVLVLLEAAETARLAATVQCADFRITPLCV
jgi:ankyrin repeat protein